MARIFKDCPTMYREIDRELAVSGQTVEIEHYQNQKLEGKYKLTKELIGVNFTILKPAQGRDRMLELAFPEDHETILKYCHQEAIDRLTPGQTGTGLNPGYSWEIRKDIWQNLKAKSCSRRFDYTYSERFWGISKQILNVINALREDPHTRRAMIMVYDIQDSDDITGCETRVPCSISYQFLIRDNRLHCIYYIRSNDYFKHFPIDIWLASALQEQISVHFDDICPGPLHYFCGSLHAYQEDLEKRVIF